MNPQMIIGGWPMPECSNDKYAMWEELLDVQLDMTSGWRVIEQRGRGKVWKISRVDDYIADDILRPVLAELRARRPILCTSLPDNSTEPVTSMYVVESLTPPKLLAFDGTTPIWHGLAFVLREERPHD